MKVLNLTLLLVVLMAMVSCGGSSSQPATSEGFAEIEKDIKSKFGDDAYYTELNVVFDESVGNILSLTVTEEPESLTMGEWVQMQGVWEQKSEVTLEVSEGSKAADFMFQLNSEINLEKLGELVEKSVKQLKEEKSIENPVLDLAFVKFPDNGDITEAEYVVKLKPENGGTTFTYSYELSGELIDMSY